MLRLSPTRTVERCLGCEAVVSKADGVEDSLSGSAFACEQVDICNRAPDKNLYALPFSLAYHGLASEAALHGWPLAQVHARRYTLILHAQESRFTVDIRLE
jgi:hypothetical protein